MEALPHTVEQLITELDEANPARCIDPNQTIESAQRYAGRRDLIDELKWRRDRTHEKRLRSELNV